LATTSRRAELADAKDHRDNTLPRLVEVDARIVSAQDWLDHERDRIAREQEAATCIHCEALAKPLSKGQAGA